MKRREKELEKERGRNLERERDTGRREFFESETRGSQTRESQTRESRRGNSRRGNHVAKVPQTRGSRPAFKSGHEENTDAGIISALRRYKNAKAALDRCQECEGPR